MNKKKKIIFIVLIILIIGSISGYLILNKGNNNNNNNNNMTTTKEIADSDDTDWSSYPTYNIELSDETVTITKKGVYYITGSLTDNNIIVDTNDNVKLVLTDVTITNSNGPAIYVKNAKNTYIELNGTNTLKSTVSEDMDATIYSKDDLLFEGDGTLNIESNIDGIASSDDLTIYSGTYNITTGDEGIKGKDSVSIIDGTFNIKSSGDAIKTTNTEEKGEIVIKGGNFTIDSDADGISSISSILIEDGIFNITTGEGATLTNKTSDWGDFDDNSSSDSASIKGIKATTDITINGGTFTTNTEDDSIHANGNITINGGTFEISSGDDGIHADGMIEINNGTIKIKSYEGIEATSVKINSGDIDIYATDDGINATNKSNDYETTIEINGGNITIEMASGDTDALDSNGNLYINGGTLNITAQSPFDYDGTAKYSGGTMIVNGEETTTITNQMMGGGMQGGGQPDRMNGGMRR